MSPTDEPCIISQADLPDTRLRRTANFGSHMLFAKVIRLATRPLPAPACRHWGGCVGCSAAAVHGVLGAECQFRASALRAPRATRAKAVAFEAAAAVPGLACSADLAVELAGADIRLS